MGDYIKIYRSMLDWEWYSDINTSRLFLHMLLKANWKDGKFQGITVPRGSFVSSIGKLAEETKLTINEVRTALKHLEKTGEIHKQITNRFTVFTVLSYSLYQDNPQADNKQNTSSSQSINNPLTTIEEKKEVKNIKKEVPKGTEKKFTPPTLEEVRVYCLEHKNQIDPQRFIDFYTANGWVQGKNKPIKDWKACVRTWEKDKTKEQQGKPANRFNAFPQREYSDKDFAEIEKKMLERR